jgi:hypothetical protein
VPGYSALAGQAARALWSSDGGRGHPGMFNHGLINYKPKMSSLLVFNRVYRLDIQSVMLVFSTPLVNSFP